MEKEHVDMLHTLEFTDSEKECEDFPYDLEVTDFASEFTESEKECQYFPHDPEVTDFTLIVEGRKLHVLKGVLIDASKVFRRMLTGEFKEKNMPELELPGKKYSSFELFLRCIFPREYTLTEARIDEILPLADEYDVKSIRHKCESWLLTELEFKEAKVHPHHVSVDHDVAFLIKCFYYGSIYCLEELYKKSFDSILPYKLERYVENTHYLMLPEKNKRELTETRLLKIENDVKTRRYGDSIFASHDTYRCAPDLFK